MLFAFALRRRHVSLQHGIRVITQYGAYTVRLTAERRMRSGRLRSRKQFMDLQAAIHVALRKRNGVTVVSEGAPARWRLKEAAN
jgi:hypothetical protein